MKIFLLTLLFVQTLAAGERTFQGLATSLPLGTTKQDLLKAEPTGQVVPSGAKPLAASARKEDVIVMDGPKGRELICRFYLVEDRIAAMMIARVVLPGTKASWDRKELDFVLSKRKLSDFTALRGGQGGETLDVTVERYPFEKPDQVALFVASPIGPELWIIDESVLDSNTFFMPATEENRNKFRRNVESIKKQLKEIEARKAKTK